MRAAAALLILLMGCQPNLAPTTCRPVRVDSADQTAWCSGVVVHNNFALTAAHCMGAPGMRIDGKSVDTPIQPSPEWDMAILLIPTIRGPDVVWTDHKPKIGDSAVLAGWGCRRSALSTKVARVEAIDGRDLVYNVEICPGDSGGPVYDTKERLIGLIVREVQSNHHAVVQYLAE